MSMDHKFSSSSTNCIKKRFTSFLVDLGSGINKDDMNEDSFINNYGNKLYVVSITGHML